jgi:hypothetical protein
MLSVCYIWFGLRNNNELNFLLKKGCIILAVRTLQLKQKPQRLLWLL